MQEAFRKAFDESPAPPPLQERRSRYLDLLRAVVDAQGRPRTTERVAWGRLIYRLEKLARHWCASIHAGVTIPERRAQLQDEWLPLAYGIAQAAPDYRVALLERFARGVITCPSSRLRRYLLRAVRDDPQSFVGLAAVPGVGWLTGTALFLHALEELEACTAAEREELHRALAYETPPTSSQELSWLLQRLGAWVASRHPTPTEDRSVA
jgi:hypothetical protein